MNILNRYRLIFLALLLVVVGMTSHSCFVVKPLALKAITEESHAIPKNFGKEKTTMVFILHRKHLYDKKIIKLVSKLYHGESVFVFQNNLDNEQYTDLNKYRYAYDIKDSLISTIPKPGYSSYAGTSIAFIYDRRDKIEYRSPMRSGLKFKVTKAYLINLEKSRVKNQASK